MGQNRVVESEPESES